MENIITKILKENINLFGPNPKVHKINVGFTNTLYEVNEEYIVKICTNFQNEENFKKEIAFYNNNQNNPLIPKLYFSSIDKTINEYYYEVIEKIEGVSLYNVWHTFSEMQREEIINQLCTALKQIHSNKEDTRNWQQYIKREFSKIYASLKKSNVFKEEETKLIEYAYSKFEKYLSSSEECVLIHNDLHFDNIFYNNGKIKLIDFERSTYAPKDFELDIFYRMIRMPWKFASEETEQFTNVGDYSSIKQYVEKYYNDITSTQHLKERLAIYDMLYFIRQLEENPNLEELKFCVLSAAKIVAFNDELSFDKLKTPQELMDYMDINIEYGWLDTSGEKHIQTLSNFRQYYKTASIKETLGAEVGTCIEQANLIKSFFDRLKIENKMYCYRAYETEENFDKEVKMHCFILAHYENSWYHFEHANGKNKGIHKYESIDEALKSIQSTFEQSDIRKLTEIKEIPAGLTFKEVNNYINSFDDQKSSQKQKTYRG